MVRGPPDTRGPASQLFTGIPRITLRAALTRTPRYTLGIIDEGTAIAMVRSRTTKVWEALRPYVERERRYPDVDPNMLSLLEAFARISAE
jgi:hypothetical protein